MSTPFKPTYAERNQNPLNRMINRRLDEITRQAIEQYTQDYAVREDGSIDHNLADRIRYEVTRRSQMGREIDVLEPARWTLYSFILGIASGALAKLTQDRVLLKAAPTAELMDTALKASAISGFFGAALMGGRILSFARFKSGLYAGAQTALALQNESVPSDHVTLKLQNQTNLSPDPHKEVRDVTHHDKISSQPFIGR